MDMTMHTSCRSRSNQEPPTVVLAEADTAYFSFDASICDEVHARRTRTSRHPSLMPSFTRRGRLARRIPFGGFHRATLPAYRIASAPQVSPASHPRLTRCLTRCSRDAAQNAPNLSSAAPSPSLQRSPAACVSQS